MYSTPWAARVHLERARWHYALLVHPAHALPYEPASPAPTTSPRWPDLNTAAAWAPVIAQLVRVVGSLV